MRKTLFVAALALAACGKKASTPPKGDCTVSVDNAMKLSKEEFKKSNVADATIPKIRDASIARCTADQWSDEVLKCLTDSKSSDEVTKCQSKMSKEQNESLGKAISAAMGIDSGSTGSAVMDNGSAGSAGSAGSDSGSAGSGSADGSAAAGSGSATGSGSAK